MWNASRCAPFGPMPGRRCSSSMRRARGIGQRHASYMPGQLHARRHHAAHLLRHRLVGLALRVVDRRDDQILQHLDVVFRDDLGIDLERLQLLGAVDDDGDHAAAGGAFDAQLGHLLLQALLHLLRLLHHLLNLWMFTSRSPRRPGSRAGNTSSSACTPASASACSRSADLPVAAAGSLRARRLASPARRRGRAAGSPADDRHPAARPTCAADRLRATPRFCSNCRAARAAPARNVNVDAIAGDLDLLRLRDDRVVEHRLRLPDLGEERVLEVAGHGAGAARGRARAARRCRPRPATGAVAVAARSRGAAIGGGRRGRARRAAGCEPLRTGAARAARRGAGAASAPAAGDQILERHQLPQVDPPQQRHLEVIPRLRRAADVELRRASAGRTRAADPRARSAPASAFSRSRSPSPAISGSSTRDGSTDSTSRSRTTRDSSRQTARRS